MSTAFPAAFSACARRSAGPSSAALVQLIPTQPARPPVRWPATGGEGAARAGAADAHKQALGRKRWDEDIPWASLPRLSMGATARARLLLAREVADSAVQAVQIIKGAGQRHRPRATGAPKPSAILA
jgi:hypothetical protein